MPVRLPSTGRTEAEPIQVAGNESALLVTRQQRRILRLMTNGDLLWEVADQSYCTIYNEKRGRDQRIPAAAVAVLEQRGWIRRLDNQSAGRLDAWELTPQSRALASAQPAPRASPET